MLLGPRLPGGWRHAAYIVALAGALFVAAEPDGLKTVNVSGRVGGGSGEHAIYVALWAAQGFLDKPVRLIRIGPHEAPVFHFEIVPGRWALSAFEDQNGNGVLDMGVFGPKEPSGFWLPFHGWRKPRFADVASSIEQDTSNADIRLSR
jgi:uncharacterized protein (DUF2141 family)